MEEKLRQVLMEYDLTVSVLPDKGRSLFTTKNLSPGEVIIRQEPYISVANSSKCEVCFTPVNVKKCTGCHVVWYCGSTCQKADWKLHRVECQTLSKLEKGRLKYLTPSIRLMVKLYLKRKLQEEKVMPTTLTDNYNAVEALISHMSELDEKQLVLYAQMANLVSVILQWPGLDLKEIAENFSKKTVLLRFPSIYHKSNGRLLMAYGSCLLYHQFDSLLSCNAHTICDSELRPLGTGLYPVVSIINHSCLPNAVLIFEGRTAVVRAVQHIPKGTEVQISYIEIAGSTMTRQKALKGQYFFSCSCPHCMKLGQYEDIQESAILEGYKCGVDTCKGFLLRDPDKKAFVCQQCGCLRNLEDIKHISSEVKSYSEKAANSLSSGNYEEAGSLYKTVEKLQLKLCHPLSLNLMRTRDSLLKIFMELSNWKDALAYCRMTIPIYERVYIGCHPMLGLQYYTCGKLEWLLGETENCIKSLTKALDILRVTHGTSTVFVKELIVKLEEACAEAAFKNKPLDED